MKRVITWAALLWGGAGAAAAAPVKVEAVLVPREQIRLDFAEGSRHFVRLSQPPTRRRTAHPPRRRGGYGIRPARRGSPERTQSPTRQSPVFTAPEGDIAWYVKWTLRAVFVAGAGGKPALLDNGVWEVVGGTGKYKGLKGAGSLHIKAVSATDRNYILEGSSLPLRIDMEATLSTIAAWLSFNLMLPPVYEHPRIEFASLSKVEAFYDDTTRTVSAEGLERPLAGGALGSGPRDGAPRAERGRAHLCVPRGAREDRLRRAAPVARAFRARSHEGVQDRSAHASRAYDQHGLTCAARILVHTRISALGGAMDARRLTLASVEVRPVVIPLRRPVISKVGRFESWPLILIDLHTEEGVVGRSYLEPYLERAARYIVPAMRDLAEARKGRRLQPLQDFQEGRRALNLIGYEGVAMIAVAGLDMAAWDALARAAGLPLARCSAARRARSRPITATASGCAMISIPGRRGGRACRRRRLPGLKLRLGRERLEGDLEAIRRVREAVGSHVNLMVDFNQGLPWAMRCVAATRSMTRAFTGSRSRSRTTTWTAMRSSRASS